MRKVVVVVAVCASVLTGVGSGKAVEAGAAAAATVAVSPGSGLVDKQVVSVTGAGLVPGEVLGAMECQRGSLLCVFNNNVSGTVDASGRLVFNVTLSRFINDYMSTADDPPIDCAAGGCELDLVIFDGEAEDGYFVRAHTELGFASGPAVVPQVTITPSGLLPPVVDVAVHGTGFTPGASVWARRCVLFPGATRPNCLDGGSTIADAEGIVNMTVTVHRLGSYFDCLEPTTPCDLRLHGGRPGEIGIAALRYDPTIEPTLPTITVSPSTGLGLTDVVHVTGSQFRPDHDIRVQECWANPYHCVTQTYARSDTDGNLDTHLAVRRYMNSDFSPPTDCAIPGTCVVEAVDDLENPRTAVPVTFAANTNDPAVSLTDTSLTEGTATAVPGTVRLHADRPSTQPVRVDWSATLDGTATYLADFGFDHGSVVLAPGQTDADIPVRVMPDAIDEPNETFGVIITGIDGAQIAPGGGRATVTIIDDDAAPIVHASDALVLENWGTAQVPVSLSAASGRPITVDYRTRSRSARAGKDYLTTTGTVVFDPGQTTSTITVNILDDHQREPVEHFDIEILKVRHARAPIRAAHVWIGDDDHRR